MEIPVIDLDEITKTAGEITLQNDEIRKISKEIQKALHKVGFMYLINHRIPQHIIAEGFKASKSFFDLNAEIKEKYKKIPVQTNHGWIQAGQELLNPNSVFELREGFDFADTSPTKAIQECPEFSVKMTEFKTVCEKFMKKILILLALSLELKDLDYFVKKCTHLDDSSVGNECDLRVIYYPPIPKSEEIPEGTVRCAEHTDYELVTLLFQDNVGGLEVERADGTWISATPIPGSILVNTGDLLERWTSGYFPATKHRVIIPRTEIEQRIPRYSFAYFFAPDNDTEVDSLGNLSGIIDSFEKSNRDYKGQGPITAYEHIMNRVKDAYQY